MLLLFRGDDAPPAAAVLDGHHTGVVLGKNGLLLACIPLFPVVVVVVDVTEGLEEDPPSEKPLQADRPAAATPPPLMMLLPPPTVVEENGLSPPLVAEKVEW